MIGVSETLLAVLVGSTQAYGLHCPKEVASETIDLAVSETEILPQGKGGFIMAFQRDAVAQMLVFCKLFLRITGFYIQFGGIIRGK
jgi:hypothetical protein